MLTTRRVGRWVLYALGGSIAVIVLLYLGLSGYLASSAGKAMVAHKIEQQIGMPVEVTRVRVGLFTSSIGFRVFDSAAPDPSKAEIFSVESADADVSLYQLATGHVAPSKVTLRGANLTLRVGADGKMLTTLPKSTSRGGTGAIPAIVLTDGRVTVRQDGRPEFALQNMNLSVEPNGDRVKLSGTIDDPSWSKWTLTGDFAGGAQSGSVTLATDDGPLTMDPLGSVPFVPAAVWKHVQPDGRGAAAVRLWTDSAGEVRYSVEIRPKEAVLTLPDASITLKNLTGTISVSGAKLTLAGTKAQLAGGTIAVDGDCDFGPEPTVAHMKVSAEKLDIQQLPAKWKMRKDMQGKLKGNADLTLRVYSDGRVEPDGGGDGVITDVKLIGFPADDIHIHLHRAGSQYEFQEKKKNTSRTRPPNHPVTHAAGRAQEKKPAAPPKNDPAPKKEPPTTLDATIRLRDIEIAELMQKLNVKLSYKISGKVTAEATVVVPVGGVTAQAAYRFTGTLSSPALTLEGLTVRDLSANMAYQDGTFHLTKLSGKIDQPDKGTPPGSLQGTVTAVRLPPGDVTADLTIDRIPLGEVLKALPGFKLAARGTVVGKVSMKAPYATLSDPAGWSGAGEVTSQELVVQGRSAKDIRLSATVAKGEVTLKESTVTLEGIPVRAEATLGLSGKYPFAATLRTAGTNVTDLRKLVPEAALPAPVEGVLQTDATAKGTISPLAFTATGSVKASKLTLGTSTANNINVKWELTQDRLIVSELKADTFGGSVTGSADVPFAADKSGKFEVTFKTLDAQAATELVPDVPVKLTGKVSGKVAGTIVPAKEGQSRVGTLNVDVTAPKLTVQGIPADSLGGKVTVRNGAVDYELEGKTLGGSFEVKGRYPGQKKDAAPNAGGPQRGSFRLSGADLSRVAPDVGFGSLAPLGGKLNVSFEFENDFSAGSGEVRLTELGWNNIELARTVVGKLTLHDGVLKLADVKGRVWGGELLARLHVRLNNTRRNSFTVSLDGADAKSVFATLAGSGGGIDGPVSLVAHGRLGREVHGSGTVNLSRGTVSGVPVTDLALPFDFSTAAGGAGQLAVRDASVGLGTGRARADVTVDWGNEFHVTGRTRFTDVPLRTLSSELGHNSMIGGGRLSGRFDFDGTNVRSVDDLTGTFAATLSTASVKEIPILQKVSPFLNPSGLVKPFQAGEVRATLRGGLFRVQQLSLSNPNAQLFADGTISTAGRVDMSVVAHVGSVGPEARAVRIFGLRVPAVGPVPLTLIKEVSNFLANQIIKLSVGGTVQNPVVRVNLSPVLTDGAVRFFLGRFLRR